MSAGDIERAAAEWIARRDSDASPATQQKLNAWLDADVRHRVAYLRLNAAWERSQIAERLRPLDGVADKDLFRPARKHMGRWPAAVAAALAMAVGVWWLYSASQWQQYSTSVGALERVRLGDGSAVELNTNSAIEVRLSADRREVRLKRGEALFVVARDANRPFDVVAGSRTVRAVGTAFSVRVRDKRNIDVLVTEGRVLLDPPKVAAQGPARTLAADSKPLTAGQIALVREERTDVEVLPSAVLDRRLAWTQGKVIFHYESLADAVAEFNRYNSRHLVIRQPAVASLRVGGTFDATDTRSFLAALERVFGVPAGAVEEID